MFDITEIKSIQNNPSLAEEFVKHISASELLILSKEALKNKFQLLNQTPIIKGILESKDDGKILLLSASSNLGDYWGSATRVEKLFNENDKFQLALISNTEIDWYSYKLDSVKTKLVTKVLKKDSKFKTPFYSNPRMDRQIIASIIAGKAYGYKNLEIDFKKISFEERYLAASIASQAKEISDALLIRDYPTHNEMNFSKPLRAILVLIKELLENNKLDHLTNLIHYVDIGNIDIDYDDWISVKDSDEIESKTKSDFNKTYKLKNKLALEKLINFFDEVTQKIEMSNNDEENDLIIYYSPVVMSVTLITKLLNSYKFKSECDDIILKLFKSKNWVMRAVAYSYVIQNIKYDINLESQLLDKLLETYKQDKFVLLISLVSSSHTHKLRYSPARRQIYDFFRQVLANMNEKLVKYFEETSLYYFNNTDFSEDDFIKMMAELDNEKLSKSFFEKTNIKITNDKDSFSYKLGTIAGKQIKKIKTMIK
jgi:hypothetical protein